MQNNSFFNTDLINKLASDVGVAFWVWNIEFGKVYYSEVFYKFTGYEQEINDRDLLKNIIHPDDRDFVDNSFNDLISGKTKTYDVEYRIIKKNGDIIWIYDSGRFENGENNFFCGTSQDITKGKTYEEKLRLGMKFADFSIWECDVVSKEVRFEDNYLESLGYEDGHFDSNVDNWMTLVHKDDWETSATHLNQCFVGEKSIYDQKTRIKNADGEFIWVRDVGKIVKYDSEGNPLQMIGGRININTQEQSKIKLEEYQEKLRLAMGFANFSMWECDITTRDVKFEDNYLKSLGYEDGLFDSTVENWLNIVHQDDCESATNALRECFHGNSSIFDQKTRILKANGEYIWIHDFGQVVKYDDLGKPLKMLGGRIDINTQELAKIELEKYQQELEVIISQRNKDLLQRDTVLLELNQISQKLMTTTKDENFNDTVYECLKDFSSIGDNARFSIFRNKTINGKSYCYLASNNSSTYKRSFSYDDVHTAFKDMSVSFLSSENFSESTREEFYQFVIQRFNSMDFDNINYTEEFTTIYSHLIQNKTVNLHTNKLTPNEIVYTKLQGIESILVAPINISDAPWGFIVLDYFEEKTFNKDDEKMISLVGAVLAQAIHKNELETLAIEAEEHTKLMINSIPLCCNLWLDGVNISTNDEALRLFELDTQEDYFEKFHLLSPEFQPCGRKSAEMVVELVQVALETGSNKFEWMHQKLDGEPIPCEVTLVRIPHRDHFYVSGCTRDLREFKALIRDIEETQKDLEQAHEIALLSSKAKSNFLANMSHEIRTPMNAISGMTDIIIRDTTDSDIKDYALNIKRASDSLLSIINDVLDISKIESGKLDIVEGEYCLSNTLKDVLTIANNRLEDKNLLFVTNFQHDLPNNVIGDDIRVKQIIVNILNNAIKFTETGSITFDVAGEFADGFLKITFSVTDTGVGISDDDIEKLFIEFERVNTTKNRSIEGTGLGLAISKRLCDMMGGCFDVKSQLDKGSTFSVTINQRYDNNNYTPIAKINEDKSILVFESRSLYLSSIENACHELGLQNAVFCSSQSKFNEALHTKQFDFIFTTHMYLLKVQERVIQNKLNCEIILLADNDSIKSKYNYTTILLPANTIDISNVVNGKSNGDFDKLTINKFISPDAKILVVDDNLVNLKVAQGLLAPYKMKIDTAENGLQAIEKIKANVYDVVFMDHMMPIMDGIDATIKIRAFEDEYFKNVPIIALTANAIVGTREMFISEGMNDFIAKPINLSALNDILSRWIPAPKQVDIDSITPNNDYIEAVEAIETEKLTKLNIRAVDTRLGISRVGGNINDYIGILNMFYKDGVKRIINIANLFETNQLNDYKIEVHALKSASASIGAVDTSELAQALENAVNSNDVHYVRENTQQFLDNFNDLLENIKTALPTCIGDDNSNKPQGDISLYNESLPKLISALDEINLTQCESILTQLFEFNWGESENSNLNDIKEAVDSYDFDLATDIINQIL